MQAKIAVVTISGRAFYRLVSALKRSETPFITIKPGDTLPITIEVAITTESEKHLVNSQNVLIYDGVKDPLQVVEEAVQIIHGKKNYQNFVVGVDPGKKYGIAAVGDGTVLVTKSVSEELNAAHEVLQMIEKYNGIRRIVKVGNRADEYRMKLIDLLDKMLPKDVLFESVEERGTSRGSDVLRSRKLRDVFSAVKISMRRGRKIERTEQL